ncbi:MAG: DUF4245 domain-containing protein [Mycolicibacterium neoaurum]|uniref:DUF4245 domain-containing protein n=1 Tax=Mycolicibacterium neoaurum TaxID=1795 RepID=UPI002FFCA89B
MSTPEPGQDGGRDETVVVPVARPAKDRLLHDGRDMFWSMAPLVVACVVLAGLLGMCSFQPSGPGQGAVPSFDVPTALKSDAQTLKLAVRLPVLPEGWQANSGGRGGIDGGRTDPATGQSVRAVTSRVGYLAPDGMYVSLTQSNADEARLVGSIDVEAVPTGAQDVDGVTWVVYEPGEGEPIWTTRLPGPAQIAITGAGSPEDFRTLAKAVQTQQPLPTR